MKRDVKITHQTPSYSKDPEELQRLQRETKAIHQLHLSPMLKHSHNQKRDSDKWSLHGGGMLWNIQFT